MFLFKFESRENIIENIEFCKLEICHETAFGLGILWLYGMVLH